MRISSPQFIPASLTGLLPVIVIVLAALTPLFSYAGTVSETLIFLKEDGRNFLLQRSMRTSYPAYDFYVDKKIGQKNFFYIDPNEYEWDDSKEDVNRLHFKTGNFVVMYPDRLIDEVVVDGQGVFTFNSWDGKKQENGHFGLWNTPENFSRMTYAWFFPETMEIIDYKSNRKGEWIIRNNTLSFFAADINDVTFTIRYREKDSDSDGVVDRHDRCPDSSKDIKVDATGCEVDSDQDGIVDSLDQCPESVKNTMVDKLGCELDFDGDGVVNSLDHCANTATGYKVNEKGCELDSDQDGVVDSKDKCPETSADVKVNSNGCELDSDNDGVVDSKDHCPDSVKCAQVDDKGCELDSDNDGVVDSTDQCPDTPAGAKVNDKGCELDSDNDGVVDSTDQCPDTPAGAKVNDKGCELDSDNDGVVDSTDQCPDTPAGAKVNDKGCELDSDNDGVLNKADLCPDTEANAEVDYTGCIKSEPIVLKGVNFHTASAKLTTDSKSILDKVANTLKQNTMIKLEVAGHTDSMGDDLLNLQLSQSRSESVQKYLISKGVSASVLSAKGYGESQPKVTNDTPAGRAQNRRVELNRMGE